MIDLESIKARAGAATPGPWEWRWAFGKYTIREVSSERRPNGDFFVQVGEYHPKRERQADAVFIAQAREDVPALVAEVERLRLIIQARDTEIQLLKAECDRTEGERDTEQAMRIEREGLLAAERERFAIAVGAFEQASDENASLRKLLHDAHERLMGRSPE